MSRYVVVKENRKFVFGWDPPLKTFFFQVHDKTLPEDERIIFWVGGESLNGSSSIYEVEDLARIAREQGFAIPVNTRVELYLDKDEGR